MGGGGGLLEGCTGPPFWGRVKLGLLTGGAGLAVTLGEAGMGGAAVCAETIKCLV